MCPLLGRFTTISIPSPGDDDTRSIVAAPMRLFQSVHGAAFRGVYDLADLDRSLFMVTPGQSGNPFSGHARDFVASLARRCYHNARAGCGQHHRNGSIDAMSYGSPLSGRRFPGWRCLCRAAALPG